MLVYNFSLEFFISKVRWVLKLLAFLKSLYCRIRVVGIYYTFLYCSIFDHRLYFIYWYMVTFFRYQLFVGFLLILCLPISRIFWLRCSTRLLVQLNEKFFIIEYWRYILEQLILIIWQWQKNYVWCDSKPLSNAKILK